MRWLRGAIEIWCPRGVRSAVDRSETSKWRRAVAKCAPLSTALFGVGPKWRQIRSDFGSTAAVEGFQGCSVGTDIGADGPEAGASMARPRRLPGSSEVRVGCPPLGRAERTFWVRLRPYGWISSFFTAVFCSTQLASSTAVPGVPLDPQEELMVTRDHRSVPFWDLLSQAES